MIAVEAFRRAAASGRRRLIALPLSALLFCTIVGSSAAQTEPQAFAFADRAAETYLWINLTPGSPNEGRFVYAVDGAGLFWGAGPAVVTAHSDGSVGVSYDGPGWHDATGTFDPLLWSYRVNSDPASLQLQLSGTIGEDRSTAALELDAGGQLFGLNDDPAISGADAKIAEIAGLVEAEDWSSLYLRLHESFRAAIGETSFVSGMTSNMQSFGSVASVEVTTAATSADTGLGWDVATAGLDVTFTKDGRSATYSSSVEVLADGGTWWLTNVRSITPDTGPPVSVAGPLAPSYPAATVDVPYTASDEEVGVSEVELWWRHRPNGSAPWTAWTLGPTDSSSPITFNFGAGDGFYEFYTVAIDGAGNREAPPAAADTSTEAIGSTPWGSIIQVNDDTGTTSQVSPDVAVGPSGAAVAVWQDYRASAASNPFGEIDIYASRWDPVSQTWAANVRVNDVATGQQYKPSVAVDGSNNAYAVWVDRRNSGRLDIYFSKRSATTGLWSSNVRVNTSTSFNSQDQPTIAVSPSGDAIALWTRTANNKLNVWSARLPAGGTTWGPEVRVTSNQTTAKQGPKVAIGPTGIAYAVWMDPSVGNADIWYATLPAGSSTWSTNSKVSDDPGTAFQGPADIAVDGSGNVLVAWTDRRATPSQLRVRRLPAGGSWGASTIVAADGGNSPSLAVRSDGRAYVAWHDGNSGTAYPKLWGATFATGTWSAPERIDANGSDHGADSAATALDSTRVIVLWSNGLSVPSGENDDDILNRARTP